MHVVNKGDQSQNPFCKRMLNWCSWVLVVVYLSGCMCALPHEKAKIVCVCFSVGGLQLSPVLMQILLTSKKHAQTLTRDNSSSFPLNLSGGQQVLWELECGGGFWRWNESPLQTNSVWLQRPQCSVFAPACVLVCLHFSVLRVCATLLREVAETSGHKQGPDFRWNNLCLAVALRHKHAHKHALCQDWPCLERSGPDNFFFFPLVFRNFFIFFHLMFHLVSLCSSW